MHLTDTWDPHCSSKHVKQLDQSLILLSPLHLSSHHSTALRYNTHIIILKFFFSSWTWHWVKSQDGTGTLCPLWKEVSRCWITPTPEANLMEIREQAMCEVMTLHATLSNTLAQKIDNVVYEFCGLLCYSVVFVHGPHTANFPWSKKNSFISSLFKWISL